MRNRLNDYLRVLSIARRPTKEEFVRIVQLTGIGILAIGMLGFAINIVFQLIGL